MSLRFDQVGKRFPDGTIGLADISFELKPGQFCAILGPSGSGKSTLLRCVNGLVTPDEGRIEIDGEVVNRRILRRIRPKIAMIHQAFNLVPRASVASNVMAGALPAISTARSLTGIFPSHLKAKACRLLDAVGLSEEHLPRRVSTLSGGQQQRVGIARAFMLDPAYVLADEPVASLDPRSSIEVLELLAGEARMRGASVLCSLHQIELALRFADRIIVLRSGRIVFDGAPATLHADRLQAVYTGGAAEVALVA